MYILTVSMKHPITNDVRSQSWTFDPATLDAARLQKLRDKLVLWGAEMDAAPPTSETQPL